MGKCAECGGSFGFLELMDGVCKQCKDVKLPRCKGCGNIVDAKFIDNGLCPQCLKLEKDNIKQKDLENEVKEILLTTEMAPNLDIVERMEIITAECVFGMNIFKDIFAGARDIFGGRSQVTQNVLKDARKTVLTELKKEAYAIGANAVIAVDLDYSELSGSGKSMLFVVATGTAVKIKI